MNTNYLFPNRFKRVGWFLFISGFILGIIFLIFQSNIDFFNIKVFSIAEQPIFGDTVFFSLTQNNILDEVIGVLLIIGALFKSKKLVQDEK